MVEVVTDLLDQHVNTAYAVRLDPYQSLTGTPRQSELAEADHVLTHAQCVVFRTGLHLSALDILTVRISR